MAKKNIGIQCNCIDNVIDIDVTKGEMQVGEITNQNIAFFLNGQKGEFEDSEIGVDLPNILNSNEFLAAKYEITKQLGREGMTIEKLSIDNNSAEVVATY